ncbi:uncharacterized protein [Chelonus insularis]|uniref:uncharacterized protein isoform X1 n=1 Tax=Chelonus insularis TaxID=460826 RepID=UPI00158A81EC|nr:uncharacterized protein LOC118065394 isoform X1 [Chelonus insularis]
MKLKLFWINIFFSFISYIVRIEALVSDSLTKILRGNYNNIRIPLLLNQLCNESQGDDGVLRDACYGCFFRATNRPPGYPLLLAMSNCGDLYLDNTNYGSCQAYLRNASRNIDIRSSPSIIYCTFLECIRQVNKDSLIRTCVGEALDMISNFTVNDIQLAQLFVNTTACILAKTRCGIMNPITGVYQDGIDASTKLSIPSMNAILVNSNYDINIIQLPFGTGVIDECAKYRNVEQATWPSVQC